MLQVLAIQTGQRAITKQVIQRPAKYMQKENIVLIALMDLAGRRNGGHLKIMLTAKEKQHLSALIVVVKQVKKNILIFEGTLLY